MTIETNYQSLQKKLGYKFINTKLLENALTHRSFRKRNSKSYERMEFLGDRILGMVIAEKLYKAFPKEKEGDLSKRFTALVRKETCEKISRTIEIQEFIKLSNAERDAGGAENSAILADICEAIIAAIYLDGGFKAVQKYILKHWKQLIIELEKPPLDPKSTLQEWLQKRDGSLPEYEIVEMTGPDHEKLFTVELHIAGMDPIKGYGRSKKIAEQDAAKKAMDIIS